MKNKFLFLFLLFLANAAYGADGINLNISGDGTISAKIIQIILISSILTLAPSILVMMTSFTRIVIVLSFVRSAIGLQQSPPNQIMVSLALFLTFFIMTPTFEASYNQGLKPYIDEKITEEQAWPLISGPFKTFMLHNTRPKDIELFMNIAKVEVKEFEALPLNIIVPSFMISELRRSFEIGFVIFIPFLIIDLLISSILMAMGMMMMPPVMISMPFKIIFFVIIDGWYLLCGSLVKSFI